MVVFQVWQKGFQGQLYYFVFLVTADFFPLTTEAKLWVENACLCDLVPYFISLSSACIALEETCCRTSLDDMHIYRGKQEQPCYYYTAWSQCSQTFQEGAGLWDDLPSWLLTTPDKENSTTSVCHEQKSACCSYYKNEFCCIFYKIFWTSVTT